ncbi:MAG: sugar phosphate isomerase/epimerase [Acidobacteriota bacterium]
MSASPRRPRTGLQLYTLRHRLERSVDDALRVAEAAGYRHVELFGGWWGLSPGEWSRALDSRGLRALAAHVPLQAVEGDAAPSTVEQLSVIGCDRLIVPWVDLELRTTSEDCARLGRRLDRAGYALKARSAHLGYHNHDFELRSPTRDGLDRIVSEMSHAGMFVELDVFWAAWAGQDPVRLVRGFGRRLRYLHVKDGRLDVGADPDTAELLPTGEGDLPMREILDAAVAVGVEAVFVELDRIPGGEENDLEVLRTSRDYLESTLRELVP